MIKLSNIKKRLIALGLSLGLASSFTVHAQGSIFIKNTETTKEVSSGEVYIKSADKLESVNINNIHISNGSSTTTVENESNANNSTTVLKKGVVTAVEGLNVRSGPSTSYSKIGSLQYKESFDIYEETSGWYKIKYGSTFGYVSAAYVTTNANGVVEDDFKPTTIKKIVIDAGHGGSDPGAIGPSGLKEKDVVLDVSLKLRDILKSKGYEVVMTRSTDIYLSLQQRVNIANSSGADFFLSIHNNSFSSPTSNGTETFSYKTTGFSADVAKKIQNELIKAHGLTNRGFKTEAFYVLKYNNIPAALAEIAFISNPYEESLLAQAAFRQKSAQAMADAIMSFK